MKMSHIDKSNWYQPNGRATYSQQGWIKLSEPVEHSTISCSVILFDLSVAVLVIVAILLASNGFFS